MTNQKIDLALAFLESQPISAAAVLERQSMEDVARFFYDVPYKHAALVLSKMLPQYTARLCKYIEPMLFAGFLSKMETNLLAAIFRHCDKDTRKKVLEFLPEKTQIACNLLLSYSEDSVGAWMVTNIITLPEECNAKEAIARVNAQQDFVEMDSVFVVSRYQILKGVVCVSSLLRTPSDMLISTLMQANPDSVSGISSLISASNDSLWNRTEIAAVVNKERQIVGALRHLDLRKGLAEMSNTISKPNANDSITGIIEVYGSSLIALFNTVADSSSIKES